ncbi:MAG: hypothetical protein ACRDTF_10260, partial [Pseudonocardiaceae bacterium]
LRYRLAGGGATTVVAFVGSATLWRAVVLLAGVRGLVVEVELLPLLSTDGADRHMLAARAGAAVSAATTAQHRARLGWCSDDIPRSRRYDPYAA